MTGKITHRPATRHLCGPGWTERTINPPATLCANPDNPPTMTALFPPNTRDYPRGTHWQCDDCDTTWIARSRPGEWPVRWRRQRWWDRHHRLRWITTSLLAVILVLAPVIGPALGWDP